MSFSKLLYGVESWTLIEDLCKKIEAWVLNRIRKQKDLLMTIKSKVQGKRGERRGPGRKRKR